MPSRIVYSPRPKRSLPLKRRPVEDVDPDADRRARGWIEKQLREAAESVERLGTYRPKKR